jgi:general secretion pathway protein I
VKVSPTPNPSFRRVDAHVLANATPLLRISTVMGRF